VILVAIIIVLAIGCLVYEMYMYNRVMDESENRIISMLNKVIDNVNLFFVGMWLNLWNWGDSHDDDDEIND
jgi:hypothetical protein